MANTKLVLDTWGVEIHTRKDEKSEYRQTGAAVESDGRQPYPGLIALEHFIGRPVTSAELGTLKSKGFLEV
jgi:hypothetical protein